MRRIDNILKNEYYKSCIEKTCGYEKDRIYCLHDLPHAVDTARIAYIRALELKCDIKKDIVYAAALLHDAGRCAQYEDGSEHSAVSAEIAARVLPECGYDDDEVLEIVTAISEHNTERELCSVLGRILKFADKYSRMCFWCKARSGCKWKAEEMNMGIDY